MGIDDKVKKASGLVSTGVALYAVTVNVQGKPLQEPDKPAKVRVFGITLFERTASLEREFLFGLIKRGPSKRTQRALAERGER